MTEHSTNGPTNGDAPEQALEERAAELSAQMARHQPPAAETAPEATAAELTKRLELIEEVKRTAMTPGRRLRARAGNRQAGPVQTGRGEAGDPVQARCAAAQRADLGPGSAPDGDLPRDRLPRPHRRPPRVRGGDLLKPRAQPRVPQARAHLPRVRHGGGRSRARRSSAGAGCAGANGTAAAPSSPTATSGSNDKRSGRSRTRTCPTPGTPSTKMAKKRAYADAVLSVTGASAIFTQDLGADPTEAAAAAGPEHGPVVSGELKQAATQAAIRVCGGDLEQAKKLWASIQTELGGYMPEAAARALLLAAESDSRSDREAHGERANTATQAGPDAAADAPIAEGQVAHGAPADPNPHGTRLPSDRDRARGERRRAGEPDPQRRRPRADTRRPSPQRTADDAGTDQRGEHRADRRAARHVLPGGRGRDRSGAGRGHERRLRGAGTAPGRMSGEAPRPQPRAPAPARGQVKLPKWGR